MHFAIFLSFFQLFLFLQIKDSDWSDNQILHIDDRQTGPNWQRQQPREREQQHGPKQASPFLYALLLHQAEKASRLHKDAVHILWQGLLLKQLWALLKIHIQLADHATPGPLTAEDEWKQGVSNHGAAHEHKQLLNAKCPLFHWLNNLIPSVQPHASQVWHQSQQR